MGVEWSSSIAAEGLVHSKDDRAIAASSSYGTVRVLPFGAISTGSVEMRSTQPIKASASAKASYTRVRLKTRSDSELGISVYPNFRYNAVGGGGWGTVTHRRDGKLGLRFDAAGLVIPDMSFRTTSLFGLPIPPPLNIAIRPLRLEGTLDPASGQVEMDFDAEFVFSAGPLYRAPPLQVRTRLTTESTAGARRSGKGSRLIAGAGKLVGVACVEKVGDVFLDNFLLLPNDALACMSAEFEFQ